MGKKFDAIYETVISRSEIGGYLPGDCVKFRTGYKNTETYKHMPSTLQREVDELDKCGLNIKVVQVGDKQSGFSTGNQFKPAGCVVLTIAADHGGGRTYGRVTVTTDMVDISDGVLVPDKFKKKDVVIIKPMELKVDPNLITNVTDKGNGKNTPTNLKLAGESKSWEDTKELGMIYENMTPSRLMNDEKAAELIFDKIKGTPNLTIPTIKAYVKRYLPMVGKDESDIDFLTANVYDMLSEEGLL
jgi:hypothetical protein